jgi:hypothetical protein
VTINKTAIVEPANQGARKPKHMTGNMGSQISVKNRNVIDICASFTAKSIYSYYD